MRGYAIPVYQNKILLIQGDNNPNNKYPGAWSLVGGHPEENETTEETFLREFQEETSVSPKDYKLILELPEIDASIYSVKLSKEEVENLKLGDEGLQLAFFSLNEIFNLNLTGNLKKYLEQHRDLLEKLLT